MTKAMNTQTRNINSSLLDRSFLKVDTTILQIADDLTNQINFKYNKNNVTSEDVLIIIESMFRSVPVAVKKGDSVKMPYMGKFCIKPKRLRYLEQNVIETINSVSKMGTDEALLEVINTNSGY